MVNVRTSSELEIISVAFCVITIISFPIGLFMAIISPSKRIFGTDTRSNWHKIIDFTKDTLFGTGISMFLLCFIALMSRGNK